MKTAFLFILILSAVTAKGQTLKELLYRGKLKKDSSGIIRSTDDLKSKIDTSEKKAEPVKPNATVLVVTDSSSNQRNTNSTLATAPDTSINTTTQAPVSITPIAPAKSNNKIWKEYTDALAISLKDELLTSKKIKKETYYFTVEYEIGADGSVSIPNVILTPENSFLLSHVQQRISDNPPALTPAFNSAGQTQKVKRKFNFVIIKE